MWMLSLTAVHEQTNYRKGIAPAYFCYITIQREGIGDPEDKENDDGSSVCQKPEHTHVSKGRKESC